MISKSNINPTANLAPHPLKLRGGMESIFRIKIDTPKGNFTLAQVKQDR
jgi:hypothetical protein